MSVRVKTPLERYLEFPEKYPAELIEGEIIMSPSPSVEHQRIERLLIESLLKYKDEGEVLFEIDVHFDEENILRPDVIFIKNDNEKVVIEHWIKGAPDMVFEIVSSGTSGRDFVEKKQIYERFGVKEYWIIVPEEKKVYVFILKNGRYELSCKGEKCTSNVLKDFEWGFTKG